MSARRSLLGGAALAGVWLAAAVAVLATSGAASDAWRGFSSTSQLVVFPLGALLAARAGRTERGSARAFWWLLAGTSVLWLAARELSGEPKGVATIVGIGAFAALTIALPLGFRGATGVGLARRAVDLSAAGSAIGGAGYVLLVQPQLDRPTGAESGLAYAVAAVVLLGTVAAVLVARDGKIRLSVALGGFGAGLFALAGAAWAYLGAEGSATAAQACLTLGSLTGGLALCLAAAATLDRGRQVFRTALRQTDRVALVTVVVAVTSAVTLLLVLEGRLSVAAFVLGIYGALAIGVRQGLAGREKDAIARELELALAAQHELAVTDGLTGLYNRRFFEESLQLAAGGTRRGSRSLGLLVLDLDHFKEVNDRYGHPVGDSVLVEAARRFRAIARTADLVARYGGEEFVVMIPDVRPEALGAIAERYRRAISERPFVLSNDVSVRVLTSVGGACLPDHAATSAELVRVADKALYEAKRLGRDQVCLGQIRDPAAQDRTVPAGVLDFLRSLADSVETHFSDDEHGGLVASWAGLVCEELGLSAVTRRRCVLAARLHDIGKVGVPIGILEKPSPLNDEEWDLVKQHPAIGARILALVPGLEDVASVIAAHHERPDGRGYPLATQTITIEARIVAVLDAWTAMITPRPYRPALAHDHARAELVRGVGTQFDEDVVRAVLDLDDQGLLTIAQNAFESQAAA